ncbi:hypothetical protein SCOR_06675 [Sulfidibacter corallicola]|uniref:LVIVD repeat-containing protein n=1 Tax=Sulfidibacter corallicola TaxID=2818388 RepID=A0A8A4TRB3_SULCO|nr:hypothetical protein [Sulfidibacter corallicola]QTD51548.1 hypothetical protein J3U87_03685 [Sulfidibacter corallicola]
MNVPFRIALILFLFGITCFSGNARIVEIGRWGAGDHHAMHLRDGFLFCLSGPSTFDAYDVRDPNQVVHLERMDLGARVLDVLYREGFVYLLDTADTLTTLSLQNPENPTVTSVQSLPEYQWRHLRLREDRLFLEGDAQSQIYSLADPGSPSLAENFQGGTPPFVFFGAYMVEHVRSAGLLVTRQVSPNVWVQVGTFDLFDNDWPTDLRAVGNTLIASNYTGTFFVSMNLPENPALLGELPGRRQIHPLSEDAFYSVTRTQIQRLRLTENRMEVVRTYDIELPDLVLGAAFEDQTAVVSVAGYGLQAYILPEDANIVPGEAVRDTGSAHAVALKNHIAYVSHGMPGLRVLDVSDPRQPALLDTIQAGGEQYYDCWVMGDLLFSQTNMHREVYDIQNPNQPTLLYKTALGDSEFFPLYRAVIDEHHFVQTSDTQIRIMRIEENRELVEVNRLLVENDPEYNRVVSLGVAGDLILVGDIRGLVLIENPTQPNAQWAGRLDAGLDFNAFAGKGSTAFALAQDREAYRGRLVTLDLSDPTAPRVEAETLLPTDYDIPGTASNLVWDGIRLAVPTGGNGLVFFNVKNPLNPSKIAETSTPGTPSALVKGQGVKWFLADGTSGAMMIFELYRRIPPRER